MLRFTTVTLSMTTCLYDCNLVLAYKKNAIALRRSHFGMAL
ncbi:hypothetical protein [Scytonema sp. HK-05]|nr:hypothetical protein [Scytonema sp. HK-05]